MASRCRSRHKAVRPHSPALAPALSPRPSLLAPAHHPLRSPGSVRLPRISRASCFIAPQLEAAACAFKSKQHAMRTLYIAAALVAWLTTNPHAGVGALLCAKVIIRQTASQAVLGVTASRLAGLSQQPSSADNTPDGKLPFTACQYRVCSAAYMVLHMLLLPPSASCVAAWSGLAPAAPLPRRLHPPPSPLGIASALIEAAYVVQRCRRS